MSVYFSVLGKKQNDNKISIHNPVRVESYQEANISFVCNHNLDRDALFNQRLGTNGKKRFGRVCFS